VVNPAQTSHAAAAAGAAGTAGANASASSAKAAGGVLGATASASKSGKAKRAGGVAGALTRVGNVAGTTLPFTGFPVWVAVLIALGLIAAGLALRRRGRVPV
jgi:hypothetical protein